MKASLKTIIVFFTTRSKITANLCKTSGIWCKNLYLILESAYFSRFTCKSQNSYLFLPQKTRIENSKILEICKNEEVQDKLAYWKYVCLPEIRANLTEHQNLVKFAFFNSKLGTTLYSVYDTKDKLKHIKNIKDYEQI